jgi:diguanylate cyclase (GGDEF)-like protein/putative nucleotidyltransferase with HDIG domain
VRTAELVARELGRIFGAAFAAAFLVDARGSFELAGCTETVADLPLRGAPRVVRRAFAAARPVTAQANEREELRELIGQGGEALAVPMTSGQEMFGVLLAVMPSGHGVNGDFGLVATLAELAAASLSNSRRYELTREEARRDGLTGLSNHRAFDEHLSTLLRTAQAQDSPVTLVLFDLDDFKAVNDLRGHAGGDQVLRQIARVALRSVRAGEEVFRVGGDEFAIVIEQGGEVGARICERLSKAIVDGKNEAFPTLSAGVAAFPRDARTKDELTHMADVALYAAKRAGKNRVVDYGADVRGARSRTEIAEGELRESMADAVIRSRVVGGFSAVTEAVSVLAWETTPQAMLDSAARRLTAILGGTACLVSRLDGDVLVDAAVYAPPPAKLFEGYTYLLDDYPETREVIETGRPKAVSLLDSEADPSEAFVLRELKMQAVLILPMRVSGTPWGLVEVYDSRARRFTDEEARLAELVVAQAGALLAQFEHGEAVERLYRETLAALANALETKDTHTSHHTEEVVSLSVEVSAKLGLTGEEVRAVELGALLHDIGKIHVPDSILNKAGPLDEAEWEVIRAHPEAGARILAPITSLRDAVPVVRSSHERWDGAGYPDGLAGEGIPLPARIVAVCDAYCAMVESRPYRRALTRQQALDELEAASGSQFDPACARALITVLEERLLNRSVRLHRPDHVGAA